MLATALAWLEAGQNVVLASVIRTWGSAPRPVGAHLVIRDDGHFAGSVSGGCIETDVIASAMDLMAAGGHERLEYGVSNARAWEVGLACGGRIEILIQSFTPHRFDPAVARAVLQSVDAGHDVTVVTDLATGRSTLARGPRDAPSDASAVHFVNRYEPALRLAIVGAVHITQALAPMAVLAGLEVLVIDPRSGFASDRRLDAVAMTSDWPDEALERWRPNARSAVVTLTHDPKLDDPALEAALKSPAFYIAALGSRKTHAARLERLGARGFTPAQLARIHGPAGLAIRARAPGEIAVAILAELVSIHNIRETA